MTQFVFKKDAAAWWPVRWNEPIDGGLVVEQSLDLRFRRVPWAEVAELYALGNFDFIKRVATDWRDIVDDAKRPVPFEDEFIQVMTSRPAFGEALGAAFMAFIQAVPETRLGNSEASPAGGPAAGQPTADQADTTTGSGRRSPKPVSTRQGSKPK